jgi:peptide chain release factor 2
MTAPGFWDRKEQAQQVIDEVSALRNVIEPFARLESQVGDFEVLAELAEMEDGDSEMFAEADTAWQELTENLDKMELMSFLSGKLDRNSSILTIHAGAGGTESCDWAGMLVRMYTRWCERKGFTVQTIDLQPGEEAGIKSATIMVQGEFAHGYLKCESGVHRLVRISPFDSNKRRHTSFAAVDAVAEIDDDIDIEIDEKDLRVDTYRSSGAGGQHVNKTDSAVRLTHLPTGVVVACQNQRSQHKNRATAMKILRAKLYELEEQKRLAEQTVAHDQKQENAWGSQIRSYVFQPYQMVKDLRTGFETGNVQAVMDGDLDGFIESFLRGERRER